MNFKQFFIILILFCSIAPSVFSQDCNVNMTSQNGILTINNLEQDANVKLFDSNIQTVWSCDPWNGSPCSVNEQVNGLAVGSTYYLSVQSNNCAEWLPIVINGDSTIPTCFDGVQNQGEEGIDCGGPCTACPVVSCNVQAISVDGDIQIEGLPSAANVKLFDANNNSVWECNPWSGSPCPSDVNIPNLTIDATYFLSVQTDNCEDWIPVEIVGQPVVCEVTATSMNNSIVITDLTAESNAKLFDTQLNVVWSCDPWNGTPCSTTETITDLPNGGTYNLSVQSSTCDEWLPFMIEGETLSSECTKFLGDFLAADCYEFLENGGLRVNVETVDGEYNRLWFDEFGEFISSSPVTKANSVAIVGDRIIERNSFGVIVRDVPIDPSIVTMYSQSGGKLRSVAPFQGNKFVVVGGVPEGGAGNAPFLDKLYVQVIGATGDLESSVAFGEVQYTDQDYQFLSENFYNIAGVIPVAQGNNGGRAFEIYLKKYDTGLLSDFFGQIIRYDLNVNFEVINEEVLVDNNSINTYVDLVVEADLCTENRFRIMSFSSDIESGSTLSEVETIDHGFFQPFLRSNIRTLADGTTNEYRLENDYILSSGSILVVGDSEPNTPLFPGEFTFGTVDFSGAFTPEGTIELNEPPVSAFKNFNGTYNFVTEENGDLTWYTTNCEEMREESTPQSFETEKVENAFTLNKLFPNPANSEIFLKIESTNEAAVLVEVNDMIGRKVISKKLDLEIGTNSFELNTEQLNTGIYNLVVSGLDNQLQTQRFIKE